MPFKIKQDEPSPAGQLAAAISDALAKKDIDISSLAKALDITYEHSRRLSKGMAYPSNHMLEKICKLLDLDLDEMQRLVVADKMRDKFGTIPMELLGQEPRLEEITNKLKRLSPTMLNTATNIVDGLLKTQQQQGRDRAHKRR